MVGKDIVEEMCSDDTEVATDGCCCAMDECPLFGRVFWKFWVSVVEIDDHHDLCLVLVLILCDFY